MDQFVGAILSLFVPRLVGTKLVERQVALSPSGTERIRLLYRTEGLKDRLRFRHYPTSVPYDGDVSNPRSGELRPGRGGGLDFHSLVWETKRAGRWHRISRFLAHGSNVRAGCWICDIHRFEPDTGSAVLRIGQNQADYSKAPHYLREMEQSVKQKYPKAVGSWCQYSWVSWDLRKDCVTEVLQICNLPGEPFGGWPSTGDENGPQRAGVQ